MANEDRIAALRQRVKRVEEEQPTTVQPAASSTTPAVSPKAKETKERSERARHTFYLNKSLVQQLDQAYRAAVHDLYPQEIEKADYLEACLSFALGHQEEIRASL